KDQWTELMHFAAFSVMLLSYLASYAAKNQSSRFLRSDNIKITLPMKRDPHSRLLGCEHDQSLQK
ncbi:hypothetical protein A2U01_0057667, partial [Trifolium medium]|nr:hypothetical protein [Trifolium medium]